MIFFLIAIASVLLDQASKWIVLHHVSPGPVFGDWVRITITHNTGAAFGLLPGARAPFIVISVVAAVGLIWAHYLLPPSDRARRVPMALILGGNLGNLVDRIRLGAVTDFIDVGVGSLRWPTFNVADIAVVVGALTLAGRLVYEMMEERRAPAHGVAEGDPVDMG
ncbi:MAG: signal peptidase II [Candidatus Latescibacterota bacterium]|nr:MAG: signal peptidase II [Candidatus Latescibacterota bacterium]